MTIANYQQLIEDVIEPEIQKTVYVKMLDDLYAIFGKDPKGKGGEEIREKVETSITSNAANYTRVDVNPEAGSFVAPEAYWNKTYQHAAAEVHGIDLSQAEAGGITTVSNLIQSEIERQMGQLFQLVWNNIYTQIRADIDSAATYSDAALNRSTYATLASYEENTDTAITIAIMRTAVNAIRLNKQSGPKSGFIWLMEEAVYNVFEPLAAALHTWNVTGSKGTPISAGYQPIGNFEGSDVHSPTGMTTGDVFYLRPQDVKIREHRGFFVEQVPSGRDSALFILRCGINGRVQYPGFQGKLTLKD